MQLLHVLLQPVLRSRNLANTGPKLAILAPRPGILGAQLGIPRNLKSHGSRKPADPGPKLRDLVRELCKAILLDRCPLWSWPSGMPPTGPALEGCVAALLQSRSEQHFDHAMILPAKQSATRGLHQHGAILASRLFFRPVVRRTHNGLSDPS